MGMPSAQAVSARLRPAVPSEIISPRIASHDATVLPLPAGVPPAGHRTSVNHERAYHEHFALIESVITSICRRNHLTPADADDFRQEAHLKLLEKGTFEKYEGRSSVRTFLTVVLLRAFKDFRIRERSEERRIGKECRSRWSRYH